MRSEIRSLISLHKMPVPDLPLVQKYGENYVKRGHDIRLFPALIREKGTVQTDAVLEEGQSSCYFHPKLPATALCEVSGRMICDLCSTEWKGQTVSFESLQTILANGKGKTATEQVRTRWDDIALSLAVFPMLFFLLTIVTAPAALIICLWHWRKGPTSVVRTSRWRYLVAGLLALGQIALWLCFYIFGMVLVN